MPKYSRKAQNFTTQTILNNQIHFTELKQKPTGGRNSNKTSN